MGYTALYRKFRPIKFSQIVGQEHIKKTLQNQLVSGRVGHAYLFTGGRGTGKTTTAKILARAVNCLHPVDGEPCNECEICKSDLNGSLTDIIEMDAASNNSVEDIRNIREEVNFLPTKAKYRVYIIDEVHMLSTGAFNALLKTLEEPPEHVKFILATTEPQKVPATILSRCQRFDFKRISDEDIIKDLEYVCKESNIKITHQALEIIATLAEGALRDALSILERCAEDGQEEIDEESVRDLVGIPKTVLINEIVESIISENSEKALETLDNILSSGKDLDNLVWEIIKYIKDILLYKSTEKKEMYSEQEIENIKKLADKSTKQDLITLIYVLSETANNIKTSTQKLIILQATLIRLCDKENFLLASNFAKARNSKRKQTQTKENNQTRFEENSDNDRDNGNNNNYKNNELKSSAKQSNVLSAGNEKNVPKYKGETQDYWPKLVEDFKANGKMLMYLNLKDTIAREINDMTIEVEFPNGINSLTKDFLARPDIKRELTDTVHLACGKEMQIRFTGSEQHKQEQINEFEKFMKGNNLPYNIT